MQRQQKPRRITEVCASFGYKLNPEPYNGPRFEGRDFFQSAKAECFESQEEATSERLHAFCKKIVMRQVNQYLKDKQWL